MKIKYIVLTFCLTLFIFSFKPTENESFSIKGKISGDFNGYLYLNINNTSDSCLVKNAEFSFSGTVKHPLEVSIFPAARGTYKGMSGISFMLENSDIDISLKYKIVDFRGEKSPSLRLEAIIGSNSELLRNSFDLKMKNTFYAVEGDSIREGILYKNLNEFIEKNPKSIIGGSNLAFYPNHTGYFSSEQIKNLYQKLDTNFQNKRDLNDIKSIIERRVILDIGNIPPKMRLPNQEGLMINSDSFKDNFVLLEFWASWCFPCRDMNPELIKVYESFKTKGFEIYGVSLDKDLDKWKKAVLEDKIKWIQVVDTTNVTIDKYKISGVPYNVLLNKKGEIIARNVKPDKLKKILDAKLN